jgi:hypothetical protein
MQAQKDNRCGRQIGLGYLVVDVASLVLVASPPMGMGDAVDAAVGMPLGARTPNSPSRWRRARGISMHSWMCHVRFAMFLLIREFRDIRDLECC